MPNKARHLLEGNMTSLKQQFEQAKRKHPPRTRYNKVCQTIDRDGGAERIREMRYDGGTLKTIARWYGARPMDIYHYLHGKGINYEDLPTREQERKQTNTEIFHNVTLTVYNLRRLKDAGFTLNKAAYYYHTSTKHIKNYLETNNTEWERL